MAYDITNWQNLPNQTTPLNRANMIKIENELKKLENVNFVNYTTQTTNMSSTTQAIIEEVYNNAGITNQNVIVNCIVSASQSISYTIQFTAIVRKSATGYGYALAFGRATPVSGVYHLKENNGTFSMIEFPYESRASYTMSATTGWKRIAQLPAGHISGELMIENDSSYGTMGKLEVAGLIGYSMRLIKIYKQITNGNYFTKARIVHKANSTSFIELYQDLNYERAFRARLLPGFKNISLYNSETTGSIPDGYTAEEIDF